MNEDSCSALETSDRLALTNHLSFLMLAFKEPLWATPGRGFLRQGHIQWQGSASDRHGFLHR
jgi:hypothetical protein